jgi:hypothetical protein
MTSSGRVRRIAPDCNALLGPLQENPLLTGIVYPAPAPPRKRCQLIGPSRLPGADELTPLSPLFLLFPHSDLVPGVAVRVFRAEDGSATTVTVLPTVQAHSRHVPAQPGDLRAGHGAARREKAARAAAARHLSISSRHARTTGSPAATSATATPQASAGPHLPSSRSRQRTTSMPYSRKVLRVGAMLGEGAAGEGQRAKGVPIIPRQVRSGQRHSRCHGYLGKAACGAATGPALF